MNNNTDWNYWQELWRRHYVADGMGDYDQAWDRFVSKHPEAQDALDRDLKRRSIQGLKKDFRDADRDEGTDGDLPINPPHLRQAFLEVFDLPLPPLSASIEGTNGRIMREKATLIEHDRANEKQYEYHRRGSAYRNGNREKFKAIRERVTPEQYEQMTLEDLLKKVPV